MANFPQLVFMFFFSETLKQTRHRVVAFLLQQRILEVTKSDQHRERKLDIVNPAQSTLTSMLFSLRSRFPLKEVLEVKSVMKASRS